VLQFYQWVKIICMDKTSSKPNTVLLLLFILWWWLATVRPHAQYLHGPLKHGVEVWGVCVCVCRGGGGVWGREEEESLQF